jgi:hypothetical protein
MLKFMVGILTVASLQASGIFKVIGETKLLFVEAFVHVNNVE